MRTREVSIFSGQTFTVPQGIQRLDNRYTHGWQVRYQGTKMYSDHTNDGSGAAVSLEKAKKDLFKRIATLDAPVSLQRKPSANKASGLPSGISGPIVRRNAKSGLQSANFSILLPQFGAKAKCTTVYIGSEKNYTPERYQEALVRATALREEAVKTYETTATAARRKAAKAMKADLKA